MKLPLSPIAFSPLIAAQLPRTHGCGHHIADLAAWEAMPWAFRVKYEWNEVQDSRQCPCGSTLVLKIEEGEPEESAIASCAECSNVEALTLVDGREVCGFCAKGRAA